MPVKIRLARRGRSKRPFYHIIVADSRSPRDGKYIEKLGIYDPLTMPATIDIEHDRALYWLQQGAQPTNTARAILSYTGVLYKKHLQRGVKKGALTQEQADAKFMDWWDAKRQKVEDHKNKVKAEKDKQVADRIAAESKIRSDKTASQQAALASDSGGEATGVTGEPTGDVIADAISSAQEDNEALLGINKEEATPVAEAELPATEVAQETSEASAETEAKPEEPAAPEAKPEDSEPAPVESEQKETPSAGEEPAKSED